jgi:hypothetical protein
MARVSAPAGRIVLSAWIPEGAIHEAVRVAQDAVRVAVGAPPGPPPFAWHEREALVELFGPYGFEITVEEERHPFTGDSPSEYLDAESAHHPLAVAGRAVLEQHGDGQALRDEMLSIYEAANEDPNGFRVTSRYVVATARRG